MQPVESWISSYGLVLVVMLVGLESVGLPVPGETILLAASVYSGTGHNLDIASVILAAAAGAIVGSTIGYGIGRRYGYRLLLRYGRYIGITETRIKIGQYLFRRHGGKIVVVARFVPFMRSIAAILAGANRMPPRPFLLANAIGALAWATILGLAADDFGKEMQRFAGPAALALGLAAVAILAVAGVFVVRHEARLAQEAERALPGPLQPP
jgi:membrane protein DedA with SNARE-associated domain